MSGKEFPNNWQSIHDADDNEFGTCTYEEFQTAMAQWSIPSSVAVIMRVQNTNTGKVKEYTYKRTHAACKKITELEMTLPMSSHRVMTLAGSSTSSVIFLQAACVRL